MKDYTAADAHLDILTTPFGWRSRVVDYIYSLTRKIQEMEETATDGTCAVCGEVHESTCPKCGRVFTEQDTYCIQCGHIRAHGRAKGGY